MSGLVDGYKPDDLGLEPQGDATARTGPGGGEANGLLRGRTGETARFDPGEPDSGALADGPSPEEPWNRAEPATVAGGLSVAATATLEERTVDADSADGVRIPAQMDTHGAANTQGTEPGYDGAVVLPEHGVMQPGMVDGGERGDAVGVEQPQAGDSQNRVDEGRDTRTDASQPSAQPGTKERPHAFSSTFRHMSSTELTQWRNWAEDTERKAGDVNLEDREQNKAIFSLRTNGTNRFLEHYREAEEQVFQGRRSSLEQLEDTGFNGQQIDGLRGMIAASGLPTHGLSEFVHEPDREAVDANGNKGGQVIASMHTHGENAGRFTVHDCFDKAPEEEKKATVVHEMTHNLSSLRPENNEVFGEGDAGEQIRLGVAEYVSRVVDQSLLTGVHLNGYHKHLLQEYNQTKRMLDACRNLDPEVQGQHITQEEYEEQLAAARYKLTEETQAILTEMSFFKRAELERVQADQAQKLDDIARIARNDPQSGLLPESIRGLGIDGLPERVDLVTKRAERGNAAQGVGADRISIALLRDIGVNNYDDLMRHIDRFKGEQWGYGSPRIQQQLAQERERILRSKEPPRQL